MDRIKAVIFQARGDRSRQTLYVQSAAGDNYRRRAAVLFALQVALPGAEVEFHRGENRDLTIQRYAYRGKDLDADWNKVTVKHLNKLLSATDYVKNVTLGAAHEVLVETTYEVTQAHVDYFQMMPGVTNARRFSANELYGRRVVSLCVLNVNFEKFKHDALAWAKFEI